ncbi:hypothetical protein R3P38DRAFT_3292307 [Favolaschia claudopus]|uniref:Uncharacterized protein n=1 Tax=Favolaschia claudopus TaxID=2862362 RepID=A0AAV9ZKN7_9AGAR
MTRLSAPAQIRNRRPAASSTNFSRSVAPACKVGLTKQVAKSSFSSACVPSSTASRSSQYLSLLDKRAGLVRRVASSSPRLPQPHRIIACKPRSFKGTIQMIRIRIQPFGSYSETESAVPQIAATWWFEAQVHRRGFARLGGVGGEVALGIRIADLVVF